MSVATEFVTPDSVRLHLETAGVGPAVSFLHGFTLDLRMWDDQFAPFSEHHRVLRHDFRGFGRSDPPNPSVPYSHAEDLRDLLNFNEIEQVALVGLSYGGWAALDFTLRYPAAVSALILVDSGLLDYDYSAEWRGFLDSLGLLARMHGVPAARSTWGSHSLFSHSRKRPEVSRRIDTMVGDYTGWHWLNDDPRALGVPAHTRLNEIDVPTLVIVGEHDLSDFQLIAEMLASGIRGAELAVLPDAGHMANMDQPDAFNRLVLEFLAANHEPRTAAMHDGRSGPLE